MTPVLASSSLVSHLKRKNLIEIMSEHRLNEIVIERPRSGMRCSSRKIKGCKKQLNKLTEEAREEGLLSPYLIKVKHRTKYLSDHLGPLRRLLRSKVGQPWNEVYGELCRRLDTDTMTGQHVLSHLWDYVERHVEIIDGVPYCKSAYGFYQMRLDESYRDRFYVDPETGILCAVQKIARKKKAAKPLNIISAGDRRQYRQIDGIWYEIAFEKLDVSDSAIDVLLERQIAQTVALQEYGKPIYAARKRQCGKKELKFIRSNYLPEN